MTPEQIQKALEKWGTTQRAIADIPEVSAMAVSLVVNRKSRSDRIMTALAKALGQTKEKVFPDYYLGPKLRRTSKAMGKEAC